MRARNLSAAACAALAFAVVGAPATPATDAAPPTARSAAGEQGPGAKRQPLTVRWRNGQFSGHERDSFSAPGIGSGEVVCTRLTQWLRFSPSDVKKRANMWVVRRRGDNIAVKANRLDYPRTGREYNEGMNEHYNDLSDEGSFVGIISLRPGPDEQGGPGPTPTVFRLSWKWSFGAGGDSCEMVGSVLSTPVVGDIESLGSLTVNWQHNAPDGRDSDGATVPGVGTLRATCNHESQEVTLFPDGEDVTFYASGFEGEGTHTERKAKLTPLGDQPIRIHLPPNGMITGSLHRGGSWRATLVLSSEYELNHDENRDLNQCFVAAQVLAKR